LLHPSFLEVCYRLSVMDIAPHSRTVPAAPSAWVLRFAHLVPAGGAVLDLAAGGGRHARLLLGLDHPVVAVDRSLDGLADLAAEPTLECIQADIEDGPWPLEGRRFAGIVVTNYLHRPLLGRLAASLLPGGVLIYETFAVGNARFGRPSNPDFLLKPGELIDAFRPHLGIVAYEHGIVEAPKPAVVQRIVAVAGDTLISLPG
jgi:SAM-dependent methyltransferase